MKSFYSKYLMINPLEWLLEDDDPSIQYLTRKEIVSDKNYDDYYNTVLKSPEIMRLTNKNTGHLGDSKYFDIFYKGTMWCFAEAIERGLDKRTEMVQKTAEHLFSISQTPRGGFILNWTPPVEVACRTGDMIKYLIRAGYNDDRIQRGIDWIASTQRHDGGWLHCPLSGMCDQLKLILFNTSGKGLMREKNHNVTSCFYATIACSMALLEYKHLTGLNKYHNQIEMAADFFLRRFLFKDRNNNPIIPRESWNKDFRLLGYPVLSQYDILYGLLFIAKAGYFNDRRSGEAFNIIISKQNTDGTWNLENTQTGMLVDKKNKTRHPIKNKWVTLNVLRLLKLADKEPL